MNETAMYNETGLKSFVISTTGIAESTALNVLDSILQKAGEDSAAFRKTINYLETPLGNPNSAYRNENLYSSLLQAKIKSAWVDSTAKAATRNQLYVLMQNRVGELANDFTYTTPAGFKKKMYDVQAEYTLLYFYNPECNACKEMKAALMNSEIIKSKVKNQNLKVLAIYNDKDEKLWLDHLNEMPQEWIHGRDENDYLYKNKVYDLRAIPTIYLLDKEKRVVGKDCVEVGEVERRIMQ